MSPPHDHDPLVVDVEADRVRGVRILGLVFLVLGAAAIFFGVRFLGRASDAPQEIPAASEVGPGDAGADGAAEATTD